MMTFEPNLTADGVGVLMQRHTIADLMIAALIKVSGKLLAVRTLGACAVVCRAWSTAANENHPCKCTICVHSLKLHRAGRLVAMLYNSPHLERFVTGLTDRPEVSHCTPERLRTFSTDGIRCCRYPAADVDEWLAGCLRWGGPRTARVGCPKQLPLPHTVWFSQYFILHCVSTSRPSVSLLCIVCRAFNAGCGAPWLKADASAHCK